MSGLMSFDDDADEPPRDRLLVLLSRARRRSRKVPDQATAECLAEILAALAEIADRLDGPAKPDPDES